MYQFLKNLSTNQQIAALFVTVFGFLLIASLILFFLTLRLDHRKDSDSASALRHRADLKNADGVLKSSWLMTGVFWLAWIAGTSVASVLFGLVSFFCLREFISISPTRRADHRSLILAFFVILPLQYVVVAYERFDLFSVLIPVYVFLAIPVASVLANDPQGFLERNAKLQWGIMVCVYGMSHVPALLLLKFPRYNNKGAFLIFFLVLTVQMATLTQHLVSRKLRLPPSLPNISQSFNWTSWVIGVAVGSVIGALLAGITPFVPGQAFAMALIACASGTLGHLVMKALKRDRGVPIWREEAGSVRLAAITGAGGLLYRVDALCFAAPIFFHSLKWYFDLPR